MTRRGSTFPRWRFLRMQPSALAKQLQTFALFINETMALSSNAVQIARGQLPLSKRRREDVDLRGKRGGSRTLPRLLILSQEDNHLSRVHAPSLLTLQKSRLESIEMLTYTCNNSATGLSKLQKRDSNYHRPILPFRIIQFVLKGTPFVLHSYWGICIPADHRHI